MLTAILTAVGLLAAMGLVFGFGLGYASKKFAVEADPRIDKIAAVLPGANCGACGFPGCASYSQAIVTGAAPIDKCPVGRAKAVPAIAHIMGVDCKDADVTADVAMVMCHGGKDQCGTHFDYSGVKSCWAANQVAGGHKNCGYGCLGQGSCVQVCPFGAMHLNDSTGLAEVDPALCHGCGKCAVACPRGLIAIVPADKTIHVRCMSHAKGPDIRKTCKVGCIGCGICVKNCPVDAIGMQDALAHIDPEKCTSCGVCIEKCPMKTITGR
ncbi:MAG TPA: hypothetical protein DCY84_12045 [Firmicutes bacterium]|nr:hypothetical protein [Bacillota bacterium]